MTNNNQVQELKQALWSSADVLRSKMDANEYKNYLLGLIFYKYLSDKMLYYIADILESPTDDLEDAQNQYENAMSDEKIRDILKDELLDEFKFVIKPEHTYTSLINDINIGEFETANLKQAFTDIQNSDEIYEGLFEDVDLYSKKLGATPQKINDSISEVMKKLVNLDVAGSNRDILGDAYELLIGLFAGESGKKAGEFYTPQSVAKLMTRIVLSGKEDKRGFSVYDAAMGSGSLMLNAKKYSNQPNTIRYYGQELNTSTYNLARMNMILHGVARGEQHLHNADTLDQDWPVEEPTNFDAVLMNPPYSSNWKAEKGSLDDPRFAPYGVLAPKSKADFAFLLHGYYHLKDDGVMAIVLPHGVLFRGASEGKIREVLLDNGGIDAVIGLPANIFFNTSIPTTIIILKKNKDNKSVLFIDASTFYEKSGKQNDLKEEHIDEILELYFNRENVDKKAYLATYEEIKDNDFNLNIPRYVDTFEEEEDIKLSEISTEIIEIDKEISKIESELIKSLNELVGTNGEDDKELQLFIKNIMKNGDNNG
ncbi:type I restriction enzyme M protein [Bacilli bacterium PM5-9]|nr:type I restriction enzyme M protein [Bacilli bacterium PM5-9]